MSLEQPAFNWIQLIFCDLRRFTAFSESAEPEEVLQILEEFHSVTGRIATECGGTIINRAGDNLMIVLNDPIEIEDPAKCAVVLGDKLRSTLGAMCENWQRYEHDLGFGVGISYGYATLGVVGSETQQTYTAIGAAVNLASRLCDHASGGWRCIQI